MILPVHLSSLFEAVCTSCFPCCQCQSPSHTRLPSTSIDATRVRRPKDECNVDEAQCARGWLLHASDEWIRWLGLHVPVESDIRIDLGKRADFYFFNAKARGMHDS
jgi:hypothetical protein